MSWRLALSTSLLWPAPLGEALTEGARAGFTRFEIFPGHLFRDLTNSRATAALAAQVQAEGLTVETIHLPFASDYDLAGDSEGRFQQAQAHLLQLAEVAHVLGAHALVLHPSDTERHRLPSAAEALARVRRRLAMLLASCGRLGLEVALEHMLPHLLGGRVEELRAVLGPSPPEHLRFCLDVSHASFSGRLLETVGALADRLSYLHASDNYGHHDDHLLPGRGRLPWPALVQALEEIRFSGVIIAEPAPAERAVGPLAEIHQRLTELLHTT